MYHSRKPTVYTAWELAVFLIFSAFLFFGCHKNTGTNEKATLSPHISAPPPASNPYSINIIKKARKTLATKNASAGTARVGTDDLPQYVYFKFDPSQITQEEFLALENDSTVRMLDFPFANINMYDESYGLDESKAAALKDGNIYGVTNIENAALRTIGSDSKLSSQFLDTLGLIPEEDTTLQFQAYREAGFSEDRIALFRICLFKRPTGYVRYWDDELPSGSGGFGRLEPVRGMQVWGLVFGIPLHCYTDANGHYSFPWRFSAGTIMGTHAKNPRVNVKPFNTVGGVLAVAAQLVYDFIVGSVYVYGWVGSCAMRSDVNFEFYGHTQRRYWSQILNAYYFHDLYCLQNRIMNAPGSMVCYAHWSDRPAGGFGNASTPMLSHLIPGSFVDAFLATLFDGQPIGGALLLLMHSLLPDMTFRVCGTTAPTFYNSRLAQTCFHELGHASMYQQVGSGWYLNFELAELFNSGGNFYGTPTYNNWGLVQIGESWAEYIGTQYAMNRYGATGWKASVMMGGLINYPFALEYEDWFDNDWIPSGVYNDLIDKNANEGFDNVSGSSIQEMYFAFNGKLTNMCDYREQFIALYPNYNTNDVRTLFQHYNLNCK